MFSAATVRIGPPVADLYRKKPVVIEAMQWDGTAAGATPIINWVLANRGTARYVDYFTDIPHLEIDTLEGIMSGGPGWWVIRGVAGEFYPCKPDIFNATYDKVIPRCDKCGCEIGNVDGGPFDSTCRSCSR